MRPPRIVLGIALAMPLLAHASDGFVNVYEVPLGVSSNVIGNMLTHEVLNRTIHHWDEHEARTKGKHKLPTATARNAGAAKMLAAELPSDQSGRAEAAYKQAYDYHEIVIKKFNLPSNDLGVALASCIAGAWMAYHNKSFPDQYYVPLVRQMRQTLGANAALKELPAADRTTAYQTLAITGMILASSQITWERSPRGAAADELRKRMRIQGGETLTRILRMPPDQVVIGATGVNLAAAR